VKNQGRIVTKKFTVKGYLLENNGIIAAENFKFLG
jgi:hypothetical protein